MLNPGTFTTLFFQGKTIRDRQIQSKNTPPKLDVTSKKFNLLPVIVIGVGVLAWMIFK